MAAQRIRSSWYNSTRMTAARLNCHILFLIFWMKKTKNNKIAWTRKITRQWLSGRKKKSLKNIDKENCKIWYIFTFTEINWTNTEVGICNQSGLTLSPHTSSKSFRFLFWCVILNIFLRWPTKLRKLPSSSRGRAREDHFKTSGAGVPELRNDSKTTTSVRAHLATKWNKADGAIRNTKNFKNHEIKKNIKILHNRITQHTRPTLLLPLINLFVHNTPPILQTRIIMILMPTGQRNDVLLLNRDASANIFVPLLLRVLINRFLTNWTQRAPLINYNGMLSAGAQG